MNNGVKLVFGVGVNDCRVEIALLARADQLDNDRLHGVETIKL